MERAPRRLVAVVSADVAGYSRLMGRAEAATLAALKAHRADLVDPCIAAHGGRIVKTAGDGLLLEFPSIVSAVECAIAVQSGLAARNADVPADEQMWFRAGIHLGDVIADGDDIHGDGVNVAARLQEIAEPGGVVISAVVHDYLDETASGAFEDGGERQLKNIRRPVRIWRWRDAAAEPEAPAGEDWPAPFDKPSLAVLPFENLSGDPEQAYFAEGIAQDIITALSRFHAMHVIARNSSFQYRGTAATAQRAGRELGVGYVLTGNVRKASGRVRISVELVDGRSGNGIWAERFDRDLDDIFAVQDEITEAVAGAMGAQLWTAELERTRRRRPEDLGAWDLCLQALWHHSRGGEQDVARARELARQAVDRDPVYAMGHALLGMAYGMEAAYGWGGRSASASVAMAMSAAQQAIARDPGDESAWIALGFSSWVTGRLEDAVREYERAVELSPNYAVAIAFHGQALAAFGPERAGRARELVQRAIRLSPKDPFLGFWYHFAAFAAFQEELYDEAIAWERRSARIMPRWPSSWRMLVACHALKGDLAEAQAALRALNEIVPDVTIDAFAQANRRFYRDAACWERLCEGLRRAGMFEA